MTLSHAVAAYGVGAGDSAGDGEGISTEPSVFGGFLFAALCRFGDGVGVALAAAGAVVVAVVPCCVQEAIHAMPMMAPSKHNTYLFIGCWFQFEPRRMFGCIKSSKRASNENFKRGYLPNQGAFTIVLFLEHEFPNSNPAKVRAICPRDVPLDPSCTDAGLCRVANARILCRAEIGRQ